MVRNAGYYGVFIIYALRRALALAINSKFAADSYTSLVWRGRLLLIKNCYFWEKK
jgi:hypothetical protein